LSRGARKREGEKNSNGQGGDEGRGRGLFRILKNIVSDQQLVASRRQAGVWVFVKRRLSNPQEEEKHDASGRRGNCLGREPKKAGFEPSKDWVYVQLIDPRRWDVWRVVAEESLSEDSTKKGGGGERGK